MPRRKIDLGVRTGRVNQNLAEQLAAELKQSREYGQPMIYEQAFRTGKTRVTVIWDAWAGMPLQERTATILRAYELAEGHDSQERIALASGLTVPEAYAAAMLPYRVIPALRARDPVTWEDAYHAMVEEGGSRLSNPLRVQLRFATAEEAEAARKRLSERFPGSDDVWIIDREVPVEDFVSGQE